MVRSVKESGPINTNIHGLNRYIPEDVRRQVRQECGFGCVICGLAIAQYEHISPPFAEASAHDPANIALLCGGCHDRVTRGTWSKGRVLEARKCPVTFKQGFARDAFDFKDPFEVFFGDSRFRNVRCIVRKGNGDEWFTIDPPETPEGPPRLSARFFGPSGLPELEIRKNEWFCSTSVWDLKVEGKIIEVRGMDHHVMLRLKARPPNGLEIQSLCMMVNDTGIIIKNDGSAHLRVDGTEINMASSDVTGADAVFRVP